MTRPSEIVRQLALAGIAVIWIFKTVQSQIPPELVLPLALIAVTLVLNFFQYFLAAIIWGLFSRHQEKVADKDAISTRKHVHRRLHINTRGLQVPKSEAVAFEFQAPRELNWPGIACFYFKAASLITAYGFIFKYLYPKIFM